MRNKKYETKGTWVWNVPQDAVPHLDVHVTGTPLLLRHLRRRILLQLRARNILFLASSCTVSWCSTSTVSSTTTSRIGCTAGSAGNATSTAGIFAASTSGGSAAQLVRQIRRSYGPTQLIQLRVIMLFYAPLNTHCHVCIHNLLILQLQVTSAIFWRFRHRT